MRPEGPTTAAFKTCRTSFPQVPAAFQAHLIRLFGLLVFCAMPIVWAAPARAVAGDPVRDAATQAIKKLDLQVALPHAPTDADFMPNWHLKIPGEFIYVLAAIAVAVLAYIILDMVPGWRSRNDENWATTGDGLLAGATPSDVSLGRADELAARGFFVEAMHLLLLHSLAEIRRRLRLEFADSLTSREILRRARLPEDVTNALRSIVIRVELSYFGDYPATQPDYDTCRAGFETLSTVLANNGPAAAPLAAS
jgi:hypothetical protein